MATATVQISHPESLEKIFQKLEQESERRAQALHLASNPASVAAARRANRDRRRTSVSISRFGQVEDTQTTTFNIPTTPTSPIFYAQRQPHSTDSLQSNSSTEDVHDFQRESDHVTQVERIPSKQSIGRSVGGILQRTLSRSRSKPQLVAGADLDVVIGVVVEEAATVEHAAEDDEAHSRPLSRAMVYSDAPRTLRNQTSRQTIGDAAGSGEKKGLVCRAKQFFRARSQTVSSLSRA